MSTDVRGTPAPGRPLRRRFVAVVAVLALIGALAAIVGSHQGPRLRSVSYSATDLVSRPAQRLILTANQALQRVAPSDVVVSPAAAHTVTSSGNTVAVQFDGPLAYDRTYAVVVRHVRAPGQAATSDLRTTIHTGTTDVLALVPGTNGAHDRIVSRGLATGGTDTVFQGTGITGFARLARSLVVLSDTADGTSSIDIVPLADGRQDPAVPVEHITMPTARGHASALHAADDGASFGFVYADTTTGRSQDVGLYDVDLTGTHMPTAIAADGRPTTGATPMTVRQWAYVPRTESALVRTTDDGLVLVDMSGRTDAARLGSATYVHGFVGTGTTAVVETGDAIVRLDLTDGDRAALTAPAASTRAQYLGRIGALTGSSYVRLVGDVRTDGTIAARLVRVDGEHVSDLQVHIPSDASVTAVCPSPNGQFLAITTRTADSSLVSVVDATSGALEASLDGVTLDWCAALPSSADAG
ncbi:hypothetical protein DEI93_14875 [Curtobacterium sp. MCBD17_035]|uniref:hypothetical protein n=1 Tax=unclassified Curtobacterium TaxID=257496 RepID=UPI0011B66DA0|nr:MULTISPECIES: hypothetical protein [unclassified Curtobacterium]WIB67219.1 hypothetical protein DEI93_14875 [Curtobacterium sp. MCBD17_035]